MVIAPVLFGAWISLRYIGGISAGASLFIVAIGAGLLAWLIALFKAISMRKPMGRWLGGALIALLILACSFEVFFGSSRQVSNDDEKLLHLGAGVLGIALLYFWLYAFAFAENAQRYFGLD